MVTQLTNWAGNVVFAPRSTHRPESVARLREVVAEHDRVRVLGTGHSFNRIADTSGALVSLGALPRVLEVDTGNLTARVDAGTRYSDLCSGLRRHGLALPNLGSLPHISVAGACATGTHGSGVANRTLAGSVASLEMITADGEPVTITRGSPDFDGAVVSLGALGVVTALTLDLCPYFEVEQYVYEELPWSALVGEFDAVVGSAYSVSVFTDWLDAHRLWVKRRVGDPFEGLGWTGARAAGEPRNPIAGMPAANCTEQLGTAGPWHERLPHFRHEFTPSSGDELQSEYFVPRARAVEALGALKELQAHITPVLQVSEVRTVAADSLWLSPAHARDSVAFHFTWVPDAGAVTPVLELIEGALAPFDVRPHWGKLFLMGADRLRTSYGRWADFRELLLRYDPGGKFRNELTDRWFPRPAAAEARAEEPREAPESW